MDTQVTVEVIQRNCGHIKPYMVSSDHHRSWLQTTPCAMCVDKKQEEKDKVRYSVLCS